jgi:hypothetical protein
MPLQDVPMKKPGNLMGPDTLVNGREALLSAAQRDLASRPDVLGVFLAGSMAAGTADPWSDIDLRVVVRPDRHPWFPDHRRDIPAAWPGFLFSEWLPGAHHCVSHFRPFTMIDVFYHAADALRPSPWHSLPIRVLHDPAGLVARLLADPQTLPFEISEADADFTISKLLAAVHEAHRRASRGELLYAQSLLDELRHHIRRACDLLQGRTPDLTAGTTFDRRGRPDILSALRSSFCPLDRNAILQSIAALCPVVRGQIAALHHRFPLARQLANDLAALDLVTGPDP